MTYFSKTTQLSSNSTDLEAKNSANQRVFNLGYIDVSGDTKRVAYMSKQNTLGGFAYDEFKTSFEQAKIDYPAMTMFTYQVGGMAYSLVKEFPSGNWLYQTTYTGGAGGILNPLCKVTNLTGNPLFVLAKSTGSVPVDPSINIHTYTLTEEQRYMRCVEGASATMTFVTPIKFQYIALYLHEVVSGYQNHPIEFKVKYVNEAEATFTALPYNQFYYFGEVIDQTKFIEYITITWRDANVKVGAKSILRLDEATGIEYEKGTTGYNNAGYTFVNRVRHLYGHNHHYIPKKFIRATPVDITAEFTATASVASVTACPVTNILDNGTTFTWTNNLKYSNDFTQAIWVKNTGVTTTLNDNTWYDGSMTASTISYNGTGVAADKRISQDTGIPMVVGQSYTVSVWIKASANRTLRPSVNGVAFGSWAVTTAWKKMSYTFVATDTTNQQFQLWDNTGVNTATTIRVSRASINNTTSVGEYVPTTTAPASVTIPTYYLASTTGNVTITLNKNTLPSNRVITHITYTLPLNGDAKESLNSLSSVVSTSLRATAGTRGNATSNILYRYLDPATASVTETILVNSATSFQEKTDRITLAISKTGTNTPIAIESIKVFGY